MPERAPEIEQVLRSTFDALARSDVDAIGRRTSRDPCVVAIGSDPVRFTAVLHQEDGEWKAVQAHASIGVPNERMLDPLFQVGA